MGLTACLSPFLLPFGPYVVSQRFSYIIINSPPNGLHINLFVIMDLQVHWDEHNRCSEQFWPPDSCCCAFYTTGIAGLSFGTLYSVSYTVQLKLSTIYMYIYIYTYVSPSSSRKTAKWHSLAAKRLSVALFEFRDESVIEKID